MQQGGRPTARLCAVGFFHVSSPTPELDGIAARDPLQYAMDSFPACGFGGRRVSRSREVAGFILWIAVCELVGATSALFFSQSWYAVLEKPDWAAPDWLFAPAWGVLYAMMAIAAWIIWRKGEFVGAPLPLGLFILQLALNGTWMPVFFELQSPGWGLVVIILLWVAIALTVIAFWSRSLLAAILLLPYLGWVGYAAALNLVIWQLNRGAWLPGS
jgi:tryptophan-rich sensory protein